MVEQSSEIDISGPDASALSVSGAGPDRTETESRLADVLAELVGSEQVPADSHFFTDLGANSLVMAQFCARVRKRPDLPSPSMRDIYRYPTIRDLAEALAPATPPPDEAASTTTAPAAPVPAAFPAPLPHTSRLTHFLCGTFQLLAFLGYSFLSGLVTGTGYEWVADGNGVADIYV
ncbi:phosphopantetheine-binding protein, partial [Streptomyces sp. SID6137]|uniref:phosphopantetheine-binding protein n=2 Tax=Streptomyces TaxID=1883 RepID=UPI001381542E|nr:peptide synthetase [Streptomyces sp. SID6137]